MQENILFKSLKVGENEIEILKNRRELTQSEKTILNEIKEQLSLRGLDEEYEEENEFSLNEFGLDFTVRVNGDNIFVSRFYSKNLSSEEINKETGLKYDWDNLTQSDIEILKEYLFKDKACNWTQFEKNKNGFHFVIGIHDMFIATYNNNLNEIIDNIEELYRDSKFFGRYEYELENFFKYISEKGELFQTI